MKIFLTFVSFLLFAASTFSVRAEAAPGKNLVVYFSWSGNTKKIAQQIHLKVGGDLVELELVEPYSANYNTCLDQALRDQENNARPALRNQINIAEYDTIYLGYPNWWASIPMPVATFLEQYDLKGKKIAPFVSHGGGRLGQSITDIAKLSPGATITPALSVHFGGGSSLSGEIDGWLARLN